MWHGTIALIAGLATAAAAAPSAPPSALDVYAAPQLLVPVAGGRKIHLFCMGQGSPGVILSAGLDGWSVSWAKVEGAVAARTRVCAWDRAGYGFSDGSPQSQTAAHTTADLEQALKAAKIDGPYVMVGHSAGSFETLLFADRHKRQVAGMVLVDPSIPAQAARVAAVSPLLEEATDRNSQAEAAQKRECAGKLAGAGLPDAEAAKCFSYFPEFPALLVAALTNRDRDPARLRTQASLDEQFAANSMRLVKRHRNYGGIPLIVLTAGNRMTVPQATPAESDALAAAWMHGHDELAALSTKGVNRTVEGSGHSIQREKPEAVIAAINEVVDAARGAPR